MKPLRNPDPEARRVESLLSLLFDQFRTDVRAEKSALRRWYKRVVGVVGALMIIAILVGMVYAAWIRHP